MFEQIRSQMDLGVLNQSCLNFHTVVLKEFCVYFVQKGLQKPNRKRWKLFEVM